MHGRVKFRVGQMVWLAFSRDETVLGFAFPKEWREALVAVRAGEVAAPRRVRPALQLGRGPAGRNRVGKSCATSSSTRGRWSCRSTFRLRMRNAIRSLALSRSPPGRRLRRGEDSGETETASPPGSLQLPTRTAQVHAHLRRRP